MRGEILHYDDGVGQGFISGDDGNRYALARSDLQQLQPLFKGLRVDFRADGDVAREIFIVETAHASAVASAGAPGAMPVSEDPRGALSLFGYFKRTITTDYVNFRGRARRKEYWGFILFFYIFMAVLAVIGIVIDTVLGNMNNNGPIVTTILLGLAVLGVILPAIAIMVRRQHDIGLSGWFFLLALIPYIGGLILFVFSLISSQKHENKWGPVPAGVM